MAIVKDRLFPFFIAFLVGFPLLLLPKTDVLVVVNSLRTPFWDIFFIKASALGHAVTVIFGLLLVLRFKFKWLAIFVLGFLLQAIVVVLFKKGLFHGELRPYLYFYRSNMMDMISLVEGVKIRYINTFPSGHTATIFFLTSFFALLARNNVASWTLVLVAVIVGFSRMYLLQHWYADVYFGMLFGTASPITAYLMVKAYPKSWHTKQLQVNLKGVARSTQNAFRQLF